MVQYNTIGEIGEGKETGIMFEDLLPARPWLAPGKKFRGKKHFIERVIRNAKYYPLPEQDDIEPGWHHHHDFLGNGNLGWKVRAKYIEAHCIIMKKFAENIHRYTKPYHLYIRLSRTYHSNNDAICFDLPAPEHYKFPFKPDHVQWGIPLFERFVLEFLAPFKIRCGYDTDTVYIYSPGIGVPLE